MRLLVGILEIVIARAVIELKDIDGHAGCERTMARAGFWAPYQVNRPVVMG